MDDSVDVIVVGAGPGGSNAAAVALRGGLTVAQFDRYRFPRVKPCGGGLTIESCNALQVDSRTLLQGEFRQVEFNVLHRRSNRFDHVGRAVVRMIDRPSFDNWLVSENRRSANFQFFDDDRVLDISYDGLFHVRTEHRVLTGRHLVGADGAYSLVNRLFGVTRPKGFAVAVEVVLRRDQVTRAAETAPCFDFGAIPSGYGWVFPKDDHWNVGLYTLAKDRTLREELRAYISAKGFHVHGDPLATFEAHQFPYGGYRVTVPAAPVYVVGDAGGFGDPIMGEGIYHALESGRIAGETIVDCVAGRVGHEAYYRRLRKSVLRDTLVTCHIARRFYRNVGKALTVLENPLVWRPLMQGSAEGATYSRTIAMWGWLLLKSLALRSLRHQRQGTSEPASLVGPLRGVPFLFQSMLRRPAAQGRP